jgi:hypothetical protein
MEPMDSRPLPKAHWQVIETTQLLSLCFHFQFFFFPLFLELDRLAIKLESQQCHFEFGELGITKPVAWLPFLLPFFRCFRFFLLLINERQQWDREFIVDSQLFGLEMRLILRFIIHRAHPQHRVWLKAEIAAICSMVAQTSIADLAAIRTVV